MPIMMFSISAPLPAVELTSFLEQNVQKRVESVNGVGEVILFGARRRQIQVKIDPDRLNAYELSTSDVAAALRAQNLELPGGRLEQGARELSVRTVGRLTRPEEFADDRRRDPRQHPHPDQGPRHRGGHRRRSALGVVAQRQVGDFRGDPQAERRQHRGARRRHPRADGRSRSRPCRRPSRSG